MTGAAADAVRPETGGARRLTRRTRGLLVIFTGDGKGKTTAAMGLGFRAAGNRMHVHVIQFIKGSWKTGEQEAAKALAPFFEIVRAGRGFTIDRLRDPRIPMDEHVAAAQAGLAQARDAITSGSFDVVILDEVLGAITAGLVTLDQVIELVEAKPPPVHVVLTGRGAPEALVERADLVTEMRLVKHPFAQGIAAQRGIEF
jgi:cob(I)alamin adenosyltransferase